MELIRVFKEPIRGRNPVLFAYVEAYYENGTMLVTFPYRRGLMKFVVYPAQGTHYSS